jgi:hypothetical protein
MQRQSARVLRHPGGFFRPKIFCAENSFEAQNKPGRDEVYRAVALVFKAAD